jgi:hypothetical protein
LFSHEGRAAHTLGFPVKVLALNFMRVPGKGNPGISIVLREIWDTPVLTAAVSRVNRESKRNTASSYQDYGRPN